MGEQANQSILSPCFLTLSAQHFINAFLVTFLCSCSHYFNTKIDGFPHMLCTFSSSQYYWQCELAVAKSDVIRKPHPTHSKTTLYHNQLMFRNYHAHIMVSLVLEHWALVAQIAHFEVHFYMDLWVVITTTWRDYYTIWWMQY